MTSIITNTSAMSALQTLRSINSEMGTTQERISSGYKVGSASDNAAYWSIATTMRSDNKALSTVQDALGLGAAKVDVAYTGLKASIDVVSEIKAKLVAAREPGVDKVKVNKEITELKNQLLSISDSASFSGENWLKNTTTGAASKKSVVGGFSRDSGGNVTVTTLDVDVSKVTLVSTKDETQGILTKDYNADDYRATTTGTAANYRLIDIAGGGSVSAATGTLIELSATTTNASIDDMIIAVDAMFNDMTDAAGNIGAINKRIGMQEEFVSNLMDSIDSGVGRLVDADMNEESTRLKALQTQQQLATQSLSIANASAQNLMALFRQ